VECEDITGLRFYVEYDTLVVGTGSQGSTFGIPGVEQYALFLREIFHADDIR
jgi:NADH:ubiquinone reductase (non-electrogenic)